MDRILYVSSRRSPWFESQDAEEHFRQAPYSIDAIAYNLKKRGWAVAWAGWKTAKSWRRLAARIDEFKPDIVYTYGSTVALNPLFCRRWLCRHKAFKVVHGWDDAYGDIYRDVYGWLPGKVMDWMEKLIVRNSDAVVTLSYFLRNRGRHWGVDCKYIPNGADPVDRLGLSGQTKLTGRFNLVYTGDKAKWKRTHEICAAMRQLPPDVKLYLTGQIYPHLKEFASENCVFLGWLPKPEQFYVMSQADAFVCTSDQDCNAKLQEYLRWQKPILGYDGRANLFFRNGHNAILTRDYVGAVRRLVEDPAYGREIAENAAKEIPVYSWAEIAEQFERYFLSLISAGVSGEEAR